MRKKEWGKDHKFHPNKQIVLINLTNSQYFATNHKSYNFLQKPQNYNIVTTIAIANHFQKQYTLNYLIMLPFLCNQS